MMLREFKKIFPHVEEAIVLPEYPIAHFESRETKWEEPNAAKFQKILVKKTMNQFGLEQITKSSESHSLSYAINSGHNFKEKCSLSFSDLSNMHSSESGSKISVSAFIDNKLPDTTILECVRFEKRELQKILKIYEHNNGRPESLKEKLAMQPLYRRYRDIKKRIKEEEQKIKDQNL